MAARDPYAYAMGIGEITGSIETGIAMSAGLKYLWSNYASPALSKAWAAISDKFSGSALGSRLASAFNGEGGYIGLGGGVDDVAGMADDVAAGGGAASEITNPIPDRMARVIDARYSDTDYLALPDASEAFVTAADDISGISTSAGLAERLTLVSDSGSLINRPRAIIEFDTVTDGIASPVMRTNPGFTGHGLTAGGAREFVIPNCPISDLNNVTVRYVP